MTVTFAASLRMLLEETYHYRLFVTPLPAWDYWYLLALPLCLAVAIVYKSIKCGRMREVPREASQIFGMIIGGIILAAVLLAWAMKWIDK